ncbi:MAG: CDP-diacylglycerol--glycerol-3-phosphate 3-phosphatidyltransferase [Deltaproteobacteria bacterium]|nr:MAG: CDP-diacylglycerol--glycerol-3-phosphate 3-phosphatidyltransferase [Deltaproteobacteria bacterium]
MKIADEWDIDNLPNRLTMFRIALIPVIIVSLFLQSTNLLVPYHLVLGHIAGWTFVMASITDFLDGYIARKRKIVTVFGSFLDPIADKCLIVSSLIILLALGRIPVLIVIILVLREIYIMALRLLSLERGFNIKVGQLGKWKTALQMIGIPMLMVNYPLLGIPFPLIGIIMIYATTVLSLYSATEYSIETFRKLKMARKEKVHKEVLQ